jgi:hypothetical protein
MLDGTNNTSGTGVPQPEDFSKLLTYEGLTQALSKISESNRNILIELAKIDEKAMGVVKTFGLTKDEVFRIKESFVAARDEVIKVGGVSDDVWKNQQAATTALGRNVVLSSEAQRDLTAAFRTSNQSVESIVSSFKNVGISSEEAGKKMGGVLDAARQVGVSAEKVSKMTLENMGMLNQYNFQGGVEGLAKMSAQMVGLRLDVKDISNTMDKAFKPESAIKMAAELQRLGVQQSALLDPLQLMNMAENDPAELQNQLVEMSKQFAHMNEQGQFEILPGAKRQMAEIEEKLGMTRGTLAKMALGSVELEEKMSKIRFPEIATEEQKKMLANISEMKDGKVMIDVGGKQVELAEAMRGKNKEQIDALIEASRPKSVEELAVSQLNALEEIRVGINLMTNKVPAALSGTKGGEDITRGLAEMQSKALEKLNESFGGSTKQLSTNLSTYVDDVGAAFRKLVKGDGSVDELEKAIKIASKNIKDAVANMKLPTTILTGEPDFGPMLEAMKKITDAFKNIITGNDVVISKTGVIKTAPEDTIIAATGMDKILNMIDNPKSVSEVTPTSLKMPELPRFAEQIVNEKKESKFTVDQNVNLKISIDAPPQIDTSMIEKVLKDRGVTEQIIANIKNVKSNTNLTPSLV